MSSRRRFAPRVENNHKTAWTKSDDAPTETLKFTDKPLQIIDYSARAIVVIGDTIPHTDALAQLGGKHCEGLRVGPGWVFSKQRTASVEKYINTGEIKRTEIKWDKPQTSNSSNASKNTKEKASNTTPTILQKLFQEMQNAFESDEEYDGIDILDVIKQFKRKYLPTSPKPSESPTDSGDSGSYMESDSVSESD